jgi:hypothetical protein
MRAPTTVVDRLCARHTLTPPSKRHMHESSSSSSSSASASLSASALTSAPSSSDSATSAPSHRMRMTTRYSAKAGRRFSDGNMPHLYGRIELKQYAGDKQQAVEGLHISASMQRPQIIKMLDLIHRVIDADVYQPDHHLYQRYQLLPSTDVAPCSTNTTATNSQSQTDEV